MVEKMPRISSLTLKRLQRSFDLFRRYGTTRKISNLIRAEISFRRREIEVRHLPYLFRADPTTRCTLACPYCWRTQEPPLPTADLSLETFTAEFAPFTSTCLLAGFQMFGEPTLNPNLPEMIRFAHRANVATYVSTNLQMPTHDIIDQLLDSGLDLLTVAVDGISETTYQQMKPGGDFGLLMSNLDYLFTQRRRLMHTPRIGLQVLVTAINEPELAAIGDLAHKMGADYFDLKPTYLLPDPSWLPRDKRYHQNIYRRNSRVCSFPWTNITLLANGHYFPCCAHPGQFDLGAGGERTPLKIFNSQPLLSIRRQLKTGNLAGICTDCELSDAPRF